MRVFLDANILFSAAKSDGAIRRLIDLLITGRHECWADAFVITEAERNLAAKFPSALPALKDLLKIIRVGERQSTNPLPETAHRILPEKDQPVLSAAIALKCDALLTGDKTHFGPIYGKTFYGVTIHSPVSLYTLIT
jgi:uncharacterized protein